MADDTKPAKKAARPRAAKPDGGEAVLERIAAMPDADRTIAERLDAVIRAAAPELAPRLWYGEPAYARPGRTGKSSASSAGLRSTRSGT